MSSLTPISAPSVIDGKVVVTSLQIAAAFDKQHFHVMRDIEGILAQVPDFFGKPNFGLSEHTVANNLGHPVALPMYNLTRDGFMLAVMGYHGRKAMAVKVAYIQAFNALEQTVRQQQADLDRVLAQNVELRALVLTLKPEYGVIVRCRKAGLSRQQTAGALGWGAKRVRHASRRLVACGLLPAPAAQFSLSLGG